jgi:hypothetical protein
MIQNNTYQSGFNRSPVYIAGRPYQNDNQFYQNRSYQKQPSYTNQSKTHGAYYRNNRQINYSMWNAGLAALPAELGGNLTEAQSRFAGIPSW